MSYGLELLTEPSYEPCSRAEFQAWARAADETNTALIDLLIKAMREDAENLTYRAYIPRQYRLSIPAWPADCEWGNKIALPFPPLISVDSLTYLDLDGNRQTLAVDQYDVHTQEEPGFIKPAYLVTWPTVRIDPKAIQVTFTAGYSPTESPSDEAAYQAALPAKLRLWLEAKASTLYDNRNQIISGTIVAKLPHDFTDALLDSLIVGTRLF